MNWTFINSYNSASKTALIVAKNLLYVHNEYPLLKILDPATVKWTKLLLKELNQGNLLNKNWFRILFRIFEKLSINGLAFHHAIRKKIILDLYNKFTRDKLDNLIIVGGGFDVLSLIAIENGKTKKVTELDSLTTQFSKVSILKNLGVNISRCKYEGLDLNNEQLSKKFNDLNLSVNEASIIVCEGVLMYLTEEKVKEFLMDLSFHFNNSKLIFTFMDNDDGSFHFKGTSVLAKAWLSLVGEPFLWGIKPDQLELFLESCNMKLLEIMDTNEWANDNLVEIKPKIAVGEYIAVATSIKNELR